MSESAPATAAIPTDVRTTSNGSIPFSLGLAPENTDLSTLSARERILATAHRLFYRDGLRTTGVDRLIAESGVAKLTFYRHFASKDDLVRLYLEDRHTRWISWLAGALERHQTDSPARFDPLLAALREWFDAPVFRGCAFINAVAEVADSLPGAMEISRRHKSDMVAVIAKLLPDGDDGKALAQIVAVAVDGAIVQAQMNGGNAAMNALRALLAALDQTMTPRPARNLPTSGQT